MFPEWYYVVDKEKFGPVNKGKIFQLILKNEINFSTYLWKKGLSEWIKLKDLSDLALIKNQLDRYRDTLDAWIHAPISISNEIFMKDRIFIVRPTEKDIFYGPFSFHMLKVLHDDKRINEKSCIIIREIKNTFSLEKILSMNDFIDNKLEEEIKTVNFFKIVTHQSLLTAFEFNIDQANSNIKQLIFFETHNISLETKNSFYILINKNNQELYEIKPMNITDQYQIEYQMAE